MHIFHRRRQLSGFAAPQLNERLLHRGKEELRIAVAVGGDNIDTHHRVRFFQPRRRFEIAAIQMQRLEQHIRREMRGESKRQAELRRQLGAVQA